MRFFLLPGGLVLGLLLLFRPGSAAEAGRPFYLACLGKPAEHPGIYSGTFDPATGAVGPLRQAAALPGVNFLALSPDRHFLYASVGGKGSQVVAYRIGPEGALAEIGRQPSGGIENCHVALSPDGRTLFAAHYGDGSVACFPVGPDGMIGPRSDLVTFHGSGPNAARQKSPHAHAVAVDPTGTFVYACDLGTDQVWCFRLGASPMGPKLVPLDPPSGRVSPGGGPRHLALHPVLPFLYVSDEMGLGVSVFVRDPLGGGLRLIETAPAVPADAPGRETWTAAEIACHPSGQWLYVSVRGGDTLAVFAIGIDGRLRPVQRVPSVAAFPRHFALDPAGGWLLAEGERDHRLAVFRIDPASGELTPAAPPVPLPAAPECLVFP